MKINITTLLHFVITLVALKYVLIDVFYNVDILKLAKYTFISDLQSPTYNNKTS